MVVVNVNKHISPLENIESLSINAQDIIYESTDARSASQTNIIFDIQNKGPESLMDTNAYVTATFLFSKVVNLAYNMELDPRDQFALRNNFYHDIIQNSVFSWNGVALNERPYITSRAINDACCNDDFEIQYGGTGGGRTELSSIDEFENKNEQGQLLRKPIPAGGYDADVIGACFRPFYTTDSSLNDVINNPVKVNSNAYDTQRFNRINWLLDLLKKNKKNGKTEIVNGNTFTKVEITFPIKIAPFKGNRDSLWFNKMSDALPYINNCSLNLQLRQQIQGLSVEQFYLDNVDRKTGNISVSPDFNTEFDNRSPKLKFQVSPSSVWKLHTRWYKSPLPLRDTYNFSTYRYSHFVKPMADIATRSTVSDANLVDSNIEIQSDLARVGEMPEYILFQVQEDQAGGRFSNSNVELYSGNKGYQKASSVHIKSLELVINSKQGVLTSSMDEDALINYTKNYVCEGFNISQKSFKLYRNFVLLKTSDLSSDGAPSGIFSNCNISAKAKLGQIGYTHQNFAGAEVKIPYNFTMTFVYTKDIISVSRNGKVQVRSQGSDISQLNVSNIKVSIQGGARPMTGVKSKYVSRLA